MFAGVPHLRVGTSSWSSKDWVGPFYPPGTRPEHFIEHYSGVYDTVEIDATFYRAPSDFQVRAWRRRTPPGFLFSAKVPRVITHDKMLVDAGPDLAQFVTAMSHLEEKLGPLLFQFPYFNRKKFPNRNAFLERLDRFLDRVPTGPRYVVEVRNRAWVGPELQAVCRNHQVALAWVEQAWMPPARDWPRLTGGPTTDLSYVRLLGDHKGIEKITKRWNEVVVDQSAVVDEWADVLLALSQSDQSLFVYVNNHFAGHAPGSIEDLRARLAERASATSPGTAPEPPAPR